MKLSTRIRRIPKHKFISLILLIFFTLLLIGVTLWAFKTGKIRPLAVSPAAITNMATATYQDAQNQTQSVQSNEVSVSVTPPANGLNLNTSFQLQGRSGKNALSGINLQIFAPGPNQVTPFFEKKDIVSDASGHSSFVLTDVVAGTYNFRLKAPGYLSTMLSNRTVDNNATLDFGTQKAGDLNNDNFVDISDFVVMKGKWFTKDTTTDINGDGFVDITDFVIMKTNWFAKGISTTVCQNCIYAGFWNWSTFRRTAADINNYLTYTNLIYLTVYADDQDLDTPIDQILKFNQAKDTANIVKSQGKKVIIYLNLSNPKVNNACPPVNQTNNQKRIDMVSQWMNNNNLASIVYAVEPVHEPYCYTQSELEATINYTKQKFNLPIITTFIAEKGFEDANLDIPSNLDIIALDPYNYPGHIISQTSSQFEQGIKDRVTAEINWAKQANKPIVLIPQGFAFHIGSRDGSVCMPMPSADYFNWQFNFVRQEPSIKAVLWFTDRGPTDPNGAFTSENVSWCGGTVYIKGSEDYLTILNLQKTLNNRLIMGN